MVTNYAGRCDVIDVREVMRETSHHCFVLAVLIVVGMFHVETFAEEQDKVIFQQRMPRVPVHVFTEVTLAGKANVMMLDTGAEIVGLDLTWTDSIRSEIGEQNIRGGDGNVASMKLYNGPPLKMGELSVERTTVVLSDMRMVSLLTGRRVTGVVGMKVLGLGKIFISYDDGIFTVHRGSWKLNTPDCHEIELEKESNAPVFKTEILGRPVRFLVDTGFDHPINLETGVFNALVKEESIEVAKPGGHSLSVGGARTMTHGWFLKGELMGKSLAGVSVASTPEVSIVGLEWLYGFNTEIDMKAHKLRYQPRRDAILPGNPQMMLGAILLYDENGALIAQMRPGGGALADAGLESGDTVEKFGNLEALEMNAATLGETVADATGKEVAVRFLRKSDGKHVSTKLKVPPNISDWNFSGRAVLKEK